ncbi:MAG: DHH family phosphoesterase [Candidatus Bathyarchaeia archaeon]
MAVWVFTHSDGDGVCAGALALAANPDARIFFTHPYGLLGDLGAVRSGDRVITCDVALPEDVLPAILERFSAISGDGELIYIDHHPLPENLRAEDIPGKVIHSVGSSASELAYMVFGGVMGRVAIYGAIADYLDDIPVIGRLLCAGIREPYTLRRMCSFRGLRGVRGSMILSVGLLCT